MDFANSTAAEAGAAWTVSDPIGQSLVRVPTNLIGLLLDEDPAAKSSKGAIASALHLLAIKSSKGPGFVLNERHVSRHHGVSRRAFQAGIRLLKARSVLDRSQPNHRARSVEVLADSGRNYVLVDERRLKLADERGRACSAQIAFEIVVNLSPVPLRPAEAAARLGITARGTIRKLTQAAVRAGSVGSATIPGRCTLVARRGYSFGGDAELPRERGTTKSPLAGNNGKKVPVHGDELLVKNEPAISEPAKNGPAQTYCKKGTVIERNPQQSERYCASHSEAMTIEIADLEVLEVWAWADRCLLGWVDEWAEGPCSSMAEHVTDNPVMPEDYEAVSDADLLAAIQDCTGDRVSDRIVSPEGLYAVRRLAKVVQASPAYDDDIGHAEALGVILRGFRDSVGNKSGQWLTNLIRIGRRLLGEYYTFGGELYAPSKRRAEAADTVNDTAVATECLGSWPGTMTNVEEACREIREADGGMILASSVWTPKNVARLSDMLANNPLTLSTITALLRRAMIDGKSPRSVNGWGYFKSAIAEEAKREAMRLAGMRPGDVMGYHKVGEVPF